MEQLGALVDGELSPHDAAAVTELLETHREARLHLNALEESRAMLRPGNSPTRPIPEWDFLKKKFQEQEATVLRRNGFKWAAGVILGSGGALAALFLGIRAPIVPTAPEPVWLAPVVDMVETDLQNTVPVVYRDQASGWTVVWIIEDPARGEG